MEASRAAKPPLQGSPRDRDPPLRIPILRQQRSVASRTPALAGVCDDWCVSTTVLIVDDHPSFRASARAILEADGFDVIGEAADGASALETARRLTPDIVLLDVQLPDTDGFAVAAALTQNGHAPAIVLVSSRDACDYGGLIAESGARGFIAKAELSGLALAALVE